MIAVIGGRSRTDGCAAQVHDTVRQVTGSPPRTLDEAVADGLRQAAGDS